MTVKERLHQLVEELPEELEDSAIDAAENALRPYQERRTVISANSDPMNGAVGSTTSAASQLDSRDGEEPTIEDAFAILREECRKWDFDPAGYRRPGGPLWGGWSGARKTFRFPFESPNGRAYVVFKPDEDPYVQWDPPTDEQALDAAERCLRVYLHQIGSDRAQYRKLSLLNTTPTGGPNRAVRWYRCSGVGDVIPRAIVVRVDEDGSAYVERKEALDDWVRSRPQTSRLLTDADISRESLYEDRP